MLKYEQGLDIVYKVVAIITIGIVFYQANMAKKDYIRKNKRADIERAIELAKFYEELFREKMLYIHYVLNKIGIKDLMKNIKDVQLVEFDDAELNEFLTRDIITEFELKVKRVNLKILIEATNLLEKISLEEYLDNLKVIKTTEQNDIQNYYKTKEQNDIHNYYVSQYNLKWNSTIMNMLNSLEFFCMSFNSYIADDTAVYDSLHQTFLLTIRKLYFSIAISNKSGEEKHFINIIKLYNRWNIRQAKSTNIIKK